MPFKKGDPKPKGSGRKKDTPNRKTFDAVALCKELGYDPLQSLYEIAQSTRDEGIKVACHKECAKYVYAQKRYTEMAGPGGGPVTVQSSEVKELLADFRTVLDTKINERKG